MALKRFGFLISYANSVIHFMVNTLGSEHSIID
jgi:hypothetical protein